MLPLRDSGAAGVNVPAVGSYQRETALAASFDASIVIVRTVGRYAIASLPSGVRAAVA